MPPRPLRLPFYRNAGGVGEKPAPLRVISRQASCRGHRVRSAESDRHGQPRVAHHRGPPAESSSPRPGRTPPRAPASSAGQPRNAPPARRPSPPGHGDRQRACPASRLQVHRREPRAGSTWPCCRSRSSLIAASWSTATKAALAGGQPPDLLATLAWLRPPTSRRAAAPVPLARFRTSAGPPPCGDRRHRARLLVSSR